MSTPAQTQIETPETPTGVERLTAGERLNFLLTNRIPRRWATLFMGWYSRIDSPLLTRFSMAIWRLFADDLRLFEAETTEFRSLRDCFIRRLKPGARADHARSVAGRVPVRCDRR